jgi:serine phosphatase RsbU (regulator of sigma subunit)
VTDAPSPSANVNTIMHLDEVLKKHDISTTIRAAARPLDIEQIKLEHRSLAVINEVNKALLLHKPLNELLEHIMDLISENLPMDRGILMLKQGNPAQLIPKVIRINNERLKNQKIQVSQSIINMAINKHSSLLISDVQEDSRFKAQDSILKMNIKSAMCVPLYDNKEIIGLIYTDRISLLKQFADEDLELLTLLSNLAAVKIENSRHIEQEKEKEQIEKQLELAAQVQKDFLPKKNPESKQFEITGANIPCYQVGGDYYDFIDIDDERIGVTIADVSGKGVSSALIMAQLRASLHTQVSPSYDINEMAAKLNTLVHSSTASNVFITFFYGELNKKSGEFSYINAGHTPPILLNKKGQSIRLDSCGFCLGMFPTADYEVRTISLEKGDTALFFTDGFTECRNKANEEFNEERMEKLLKKHHKLSSQKLLEKIYDEVNSYTAGTEQMDDMTLVIVKRTT